MARLVGVDLPREKRVEVAPRLDPIPPELSKRVDSDLARKLAVRFFAIFPVAFDSLLFDRGYFLLSPDPAGFRAIQRELPYNFVMIDFTLTDDQKQLQELARKFAKDEIAPKAAIHDKEGKFPREVVEKAWEVGLMNTHIPGDYGGLGLGVLDGALITEELAYGCTGICTAIEANSLASAPVIVAGNDEQKKEFLGMLTAEPKFAAYCVTEPGAGSDVSGIRTIAKKDGSDYVIDGSKMWITNAPIADLAVVWAKTDEGIRGFIVERGIFSDVMGNVSDRDPKNKPAFARTFDVNSVVEVARRLSVDRDERNVGEIRSIRIF
jgi:hypothetical protein